MKFVFKKSSRSFFFSSVIEYVWVTTVYAMNLLIVAPHVTCGHFSFLRGLVTCVWAKNVILYFCCLTPGHISTPKSCIQLMSVSMNRSLHINLIIDIVWNASIKQDKVVLEINCVTHYLWNTETWCMSSELFHKQPWTTLILLLFLCINYFSAVMLDLCSLLCEPFLLDMCSQGRHCFTLPSSLPAITKCKLIIK